MATQPNMAQSRRPFWPLFVNLNIKVFVAVIEILIDVAVIIDVLVLVRFRRWLLIVVVAAAIVEAAVAAKVGSKRPPCFLKRLYSMDIVNLFKKQVM